jgi:hypothetical protein
MRVSIGLAIPPCRNQYATPRKASPAGSGATGGDYAPQLQVKQGFTEPGHCGDAIATGKVVHSG